MSEYGKKVILGAVVAVILAAGLAASAIYLGNSGAGGLTSSLFSSSNSNSTQQGAGSFSSQSSQAQSGTPTSSSGILGETGTFNIYLTDAPPSAPQFKYLLINVSSVVLSYAGNVSQTAPHDQWAYNVPANVGTNVNTTDLQGKSILLGATKAPAGNVTRVIFNITGAIAHFTDGNTSQLKIVADGKLMLQINFTVSNSGTTDLTIDITPNSIHVSQGHAQVLTPVIHVSVVESKGSSTITHAVQTSLSETESAAISTTTDTSTSSLASTSTSSSTAAASTSA